MHDSLWRNNATVAYLLLINQINENYEIRQKIFPI